VLPKLSCLKIGQTSLIASVEQLAHSPMFSNKPERRRLGGEYRGHGGTKGVQRSGMGNPILVVLAHVLSEAPLGRRNHHSRPYQTRSETSSCPPLADQPWVERLRPLRREGTTSA